MALSGIPPEHHAEIDSLISAVFNKKSSIEEKIAAAEKVHNFVNVLIQRHSIKNVAEQTALAKKIIEKVSSGASPVPEFDIEMAMMILTASRTGVQISPQSLQEISSQFKL